MVWHPGIIGNRVLVHVDDGGDAGVVSFPSRFALSCKPGHSPVVPPTFIRYLCLNHQVINRNTAPPPPVTAHAVASASDPAVTMETTSKQLEGAIITYNPHSTITKTKTKRSSTSKSQSTKHKST
jgi:hypothetical protein